MTIIRSLPWLALTLPACVANDVPADPPTATLIASAPSNALGVTRWEVHSEGDTAARVIGLGADAERRIELVATQDKVAPADRVHLEVVFPEQGTFDLSRGGAVDGAATPLTLALGKALTADVAEHTVPQEAAAQVYLQGEGHLQMGWSFFGYANNIDVNGWCQQGTRDHYDAYPSNGASCWVNFWTSQSPYDCRINLHYGISGFRTDTCNWFVYANF